MVGSEESLGYISEPLMSDEMKSIPLLCWQETNLSTIWIPSNLLKNRNEPRNAQVTRDIFHRLEKRDPSKFMASFQAYIPSEDEFLETFFSDDEDLLDEQNTTECFKNGSENKLSQGYSVFPSNKNNFETVQNKSGSENKFKAFENYNIVNELCVDGGSQNFSRSNSQFLNQTKLKKTESYISLNEILDDTPEFNIKDTELPHKTSLNQKKSKQKKGKKNIRLDEFLSDYTPQDYQDACCQDYYHKLKAKSHNDDDISIKSAAQFPVLEPNPKLEPNEIKFVKPEKVKESLADSQSILKSFTDAFNLAEKTENVITNKSVKPDEEMLNKLEMTDKISSAACAEPVNTCGKLVVENIPCQTTEDEVQDLFCTYGEIKSFSLEPFGGFLKATIEISLECDVDIDWIIDCIDGTEPFGASTCAMKCYQQF